MTRVLFCPPTYFEVRDVKNPFMQPGAPLDTKLALEQWEAVRRAFREAGCTLETIPAVSDLEDMVFANNQVFVGASADGPFIVPSRMRYESRRREVPHFVAWFRERGFRVIELDYGDDFLEGHGDLLWDIGGKIIWAGYGHRSTRGGVEKLAAAMAPLGFKVVPLELVDPVFYHLDTCLAPLTAESVVIYPGAFSAEAERALRAHCPRVYEVSRTNALTFVCNGVAANRHFITPGLTPVLEEALWREELTPVVVNTSEFQKSGGSVCCLKLFLP